MLFLFALVIFFPLLQVSLPASILPAKPQPVELSYLCTTVIPAEVQKIRYDDVPIIAIHGFSGSKVTWDNISEPLSLNTGRKVCVVDLRNHGDSPWNSEEFNVEAMAEDIRHFIDRLQVQKAIVIGHSLGGKIVANLAMNYPERLEKIIIEDIRPFSDPRDGLDDGIMYFRVLRSLAEDVPQGLSEMEAKNQFLKLFNERLKKNNASFTLNDPKDMPIKCSNGKCQFTYNPIIIDALLNDTSEFLNENGPWKFYQFDGPALFIYGGKSVYKVGEDKINIKKRFPQAKFVEVPESGHTVHEYEKFLTEVVKFINDDEEENPCPCKMLL